MRLPDFQEVTEFIRRVLSKKYAAEKRLEENWHTTAKLLTFNPQTTKTLVELEDEIENLEAWRMEDAASIGYPKFSTDTVIAYFHADIQKVLDVSGLTAERQQKYLISTIRRLTELVHLIPASRQYHHRECGGLLLHSLEVAYRANQIARNRYFETSQDINDKSALQLKWILACTLGGLCHDAGKVLTDCVIRPNRTGKKYEPYSGSLVDWMSRTKEMTYQVTWVAKGTEHEDALGSLFRDLISNETREYLGGRISEELCLYFEHRLPKENTLCGVITEADSSSVNDNQQAGSFNRTPVGTLQDRESENFIAAFRRLLFIGAHSRDENGVIQPVDRNGIKIKGWSVNEHDSAVWFCTVDDPDLKRSVKRLFIATSALMDIRSIYAAFNVTSTLYHEKRIKDSVPRNDSPDKNEGKDSGLNPKRFRIEDAAKESLAEENERELADIRAEQEMDLLNLLEELHENGFIEVCPRKGEDAFVPDYRRFYWTIAKFFASDPDEVAQKHEPFRAICFSEKAINLLFVNENDVPKSADGYSIFNENKEYRLTLHVSPVTAVKDAKNEENRKAAQGEQIAAPGETSPEPKQNGSSPQQNAGQNGQSGQSGETASEAAGVSSSSEQDKPKPVNPLKAALAVLAESKKRNEREAKSSAGSSAPKTVSLEDCLPKSGKHAQENEQKRERERELAKKQGQQNQQSQPKTESKPAETQQTKQTKQAGQAGQAKQSNPSQPASASAQKPNAQSLMPTGHAFGKGLNKSQKQSQKQKNGNGNGNGNATPNKGNGNNVNSGNNASVSKPAKQQSAPQGAAGNAGNGNVNNAGGSVPKKKKKKKKSGANAQNGQNPQNAQGAQNAQSQSNQSNHGNQNSQNVSGANVPNVPNHPNAQSNPQSKTDADAQRTGERGAAASSDKNLGQSEGSHAGNGAKSGTGTGTATAGGALKPTETKEEKAEKSEAASAGVSKPAEQQAKQAKTQAEAPARSERKEERKEERKDEGGDAKDADNAEDAEATADAYLNAALNGTLGDGEDGETEELEELEDPEDEEDPEESADSETFKESTENAENAENVAAKNEITADTADTADSDSENADAEMSEPAEPSEPSEPEFFGDPWTVELTDRQSGLRWTVRFDGEGSADGWTAEAEVPFGADEVYVFKDDPRVTVRKGKPYTSAEKHAENALEPLNLLLPHSPAPTPSQSTGTDSVSGNSEPSNPSKKDKKPAAPASAKAPAPAKTTAPAPTVSGLPFFRKGMPKISKNEFVRRLRSEFASETPEITFIEKADGTRVLEADTFNALLRMSGLGISVAAEAVTNSWDGIIYDDASKSFQAVETEEDDEDDFDESGGDYDT